MKSEEKPYIQAKLDNVSCPIELYAAASVTFDNAEVEMNYDHSHPESASIIITDTACGRSLALSFSNTNNEVVASRAYFSKNAGRWLDGKFAYYTPMSKEESSSYIKEFARSCGGIVNTSVVNASTNHKESFVASGYGLLSNEVRLSLMAKAAAQIMTDVTKSLFRGIPGMKSDVCVDILQENLKELLDSTIDGVELGKIYAKPAENKNQMTP